MQINPVLAGGARDLVEGGGMSLLPRRIFLQTSIQTIAGLCLGAAVFGASARAEEGAAKSLFDGKSLKGWKRTEFSGGADVRVEEGVISVESGEEMSGFHYDGHPPTKDYEFEVEARRISGLDFFCTVTFPVEEQFLSFVVGGWGGSLVGISSINRQDASMNETTLQRQFQDKVWYRIKVRVAEGKVQAWIDQEKVVDFEIKGKELGLRPGEIELSKPLGVATFRTGAEFRNLRLRKVSQAVR